MTFLDKAAGDCSEVIRGLIVSASCPQDHGLKNPDKQSCHAFSEHGYTCRECWDREYKEDENERRWN